MFSIRNGFSFGAGAVLFGFFLEVGWMWGPQLHLFTLGKKTMKWKPLAQHIWWQACGSVIWLCVYLNFKEVGCSTVLSTGSEQDTGSGCWKRNAAFSATPEWGFSPHLLQSPWSRTVKAVLWTSPFSCGGNNRDERLDLKDKGFNPAQ